MFSLQTATITYCSIAILVFSAGTAFGIDNRNHGLQDLGETNSPVSHDEAIESGNAKSDRETMARSTQKAHGLLELRQNNHNDARALRLNKNKPQTSAANKKSNRTTGTTSSFDKTISNNNNKTARNKKNKNNINLDNIEFEIGNGHFKKKKNGATKSDSNTAEKMNTRKNDQKSDGESIAKQLANTKVILRPLLVTSTTDSNRKKNNSRAKQSTTTGTVKNSFADNTTTKYPFKYPTIRYIPWTELSIDTQKIMSKTLGYNKSTWNNMGTNMIELKLFRELSLNEQEGWRLLGLDEHVWDCFVNRTYQAILYFLFVCVFNSLFELIYLFFRIFLPCHVTTIYCFSLSRLHFLRKERSSPNKCLRPFYRIEGCMVSTMETAQSRTTVSGESTLLV